MRRGEDVESVKPFPAAWKGTPNSGPTDRPREATLTGKGQHLLTVTGQIHELWLEGALKRETGTLLPVQWLRLHLNKVG